MDEHDRIVRWRQLIDLLARLPETHDGALADAAFALVEREAVAIPEAVRAATARQAAAYPLDPRVVALFARDKLVVAAPVLASANLSAMEWHDIARDCSAEVANFIQTLARTVPLASRDTVPAIEPNLPSPTNADPIDEDDGEPPSISQMVARIEQLRSRRDGGDDIAKASPPVAAPAIPKPAPSYEAVPAGAGLFRWESDSEGRIVWVDGIPRGALVGQSLGETSGAQGIGRALAEREPFADQTMTLETPAVGGPWQLSGVPAFSPVDGHFLGYRGVARQPDAQQESGGPERRINVRPGRKVDLDALRETIHDIKTPLNAIIGFAEIIDGQYLGPAHRNYRQRAAEIVTQARMLLEAVQDLDIAARMQAAGQEAGNGSRLVDVFNSIEPELQDRAANIGALLSLHPAGRTDRSALSIDLATRLLRRYIGSVIDAAAPGEKITVTASRDDDKVVVAVTRPASTTSMSESMLLDPAAADQGGLLGLGFSLRLLRGLVRLVGGDLSIGPERIELLLPAD
ncbi:histidine kinase dimerization/phospho-acceptor domain-containing protein [Sphingomonas jaspsi]|uniref:histidine kinase dimerization/phospho-acceptor domain-containing protein n=1 Tax=Sphingomonas jaspsi TaxID=392409 RepID=UPI0004B23D44|nr:histidine kinase dimerization/phospho-acceptor domain-containing protein [Sphingomonas jaspsi]